MYDGCGFYFHETLLGARPFSGSRGCKGSRALHIKHDASGEFDSASRGVLIALRFFYARCYFVLEMFMALNAGTSDD